MIKKYDKIGHWRVLSLESGNLWKCRCSCGREEVIPEKKLLSGVSTSCGCHKSRIKDLTGQRFGRLTIIEPLIKRDIDHSVRWLCRCDCGKYTSVSSNKLRTGHTQSCGCKKKSIILQETKTFIDGTCVEIILSDKLPVNNTSGFNGVCKKRNKWQAYVNYAKQRINLGTFSTIEEACQARRDAMDRIRIHLEGLIYEENSPAFMQVPLRL